MTVKRSTGKTGRPARVPGEKHTSEKIFDVAVDLFARQGYDRTSVREIARGVGITESAVYRHYPSKDAILEAIFTYVETQVYSPLPLPCRSEDTAERSIFRDMLEGLPGFIMSDPYLAKVFQILFTEMYHNIKIREYLKTEYGEKADDYVEEIFRKHMEEGTIRPCDPRAMAKIFNGFRFSWLFQEFIINSGEDPDPNMMEKDLHDIIRWFEDLLIPDVNLNDTSG